MIFDNGYGIIHPDKYILGPNERYGIANDMEFQNFARKVRQDEKSETNTNIKFIQ